MKHQGKTLFTFHAAVCVKAVLILIFSNTLVFSESCVLSYTPCFCIIDLVQCCLKCIIDPADEMASVSGRKPWAISPGSVYSRVWWTATPTSTKFLCMFPPEFKTDLFVGSHFFFQKTTVFLMFLGLIRVDEPSTWCVLSLLLLHPFQVFPSYTHHPLSGYIWLSI